MELLEAGGVLGGAADQEVEVMVPFLHVALVVGLVLQRLRRLLLLTSTWRTSSTWAPRSAS